MDFDLTDEQTLLRDITRDLLTRTYDIETRLKVTDTELGWSREVWSQLAEIGILGLGFETPADGRPDRGDGRAHRDRPPAGARTGRWHAALIPGGLIAALGDDAAQRVLLDGVAEGAPCWPSRTTSPASGGTSTGRPRRGRAARRFVDLTGVKNPVPPVTARTCSSSAPRCPTAASDCSWSTPSRGAHAPYRTFDGSARRADRHWIRSRRNRSAPAATSDAPAIGGALIRRSRRCARRRSARWRRRCG